MNKLLRTALTTVILLAAPLANAAVISFALQGSTSSFFSSLFSGSSSAGTQRLVLQTVVPVPGAFLLYGSALFGLGLISRARSK